jgi:hypothetical protein
MIAGMPHNECRDRDRLDAAGRRIEMLTPSGRRSSSSSSRSSRTSSRRPWRARRRALAFASPALVAHEPRGDELADESAHVPAKPTVDELLDAARPASILALVAAPFAVARSRLDTGVRSSSGSSSRSMCMPTVSSEKVAVAPRK